MNILDSLNAAFEWWWKSPQQRQDARDAEAVVERLADPEWSPFKGLIDYINDSADPDYNPEKRHG